MISRKRIQSASTAVACFSFLIFQSPARCEDYPNRIIKIVQPFAAGGSTDVLARILAQKLTDYLGQPVIVEARPGANGIMGTQSVAKSPPDG
jgi:tripartite-type tricarboxylate transporter receptor subunit TctC